MSLKIQLKRGTDAQVQAATLAIGEMGFATDTKAIYVYDGVAKQMVGRAGVDTLANRPAHGVPGRFFMDSATSILYLDTGAAWVIVQAETPYKAGIKVLSFTQATSSPALLLDPPDAAVITKVVIVVDTAAATSVPTCSVGVSGTAGRDMATTDNDIKTLGTYIVEPYTACGTGGANISLTITPDSQTFSGRCYLHYVVPA